MSKDIAFGSLVWISWSVVLASYLLDIRWTIGFVLLNIVMVLVLPILFPFVEMSMIVSSFAFISVISAISLLGSWLLQNVNTALRNAQHEVVQNERLAVLGRLSGGVGHELRNPLAALKNSVYFLKMVFGDYDDKEVQETLGIMDHEIATSEVIISSLLDFSRPKPPIRKKVEINGLIQKTLSRIEIPEIIELDLDLQSDLPILLADSLQLNRVMENIIRNAIQAMPKGGTLTISTKVTEFGIISVSISDTGIGIPPENMKRLFEPLFTTKTKGVGLGLAIVKTFVEVHGGSVYAESKLGDGSTLTVEFPTTGLEVA
jgi:signal transduction histidine kinase